RTVVCPSFSMYNTIYPCVLTSFVAITTEGFELLATLDKRQGEFLLLIVQSERYSLERCYLLRARERRNHNFLIASTEFLAIPIDTIGPDLEKFATLCFNVLGIHYLKGRHRS